MIANCQRQKLASFLFIVGVFLVPLIGCALFTPSNVKQALDASELACIMSKQLTDSKALADICKIDHALVPIIDSLIGQREAARAQGAQWGDTLDGGKVGNANVACVAADAGARKDGAANAP